MVVDATKNDVNNAPAEKASAWGWVKNVLNNVSNGLDKAVELSNDVKTLKAKYNSIFASDKQTTVAKDALSAGIPVWLPAVAVGALALLFIKR